MSLRFLLNADARSLGEAKADVPKAHATRGFLSGARAGRGGTRRPTPSQPRAPSARPRDLHLALPADSAQASVAETSSPALAPVQSSTPWQSARPPAG